MATRLTGFSKFILTLLVIIFIGVGLFYANKSGMFDSYSVGDCIKRKTDNKEFTFVGTSGADIKLQYDDAHGVIHTVKIHHSLLERCGKSQ